MIFRCTSAISFRDKEVFFSFNKSGYLIQFFRKYTKNNYHFNIFK